VSPDELPRENFPGGDVVPREGELRICIEKKAYAEILSHAKEEADIEICGVLLGKLKQDKHGSFLHIEHTIRGEKAKGAGAQVTFTHETWNHIYAEQEKTCPKADIIGWYHTHPGFDIFLSDMDKFIHNNFFGAPHQVAYVYDPHQGTEGFFRRDKDEIVQIDKFWHGGKMRKIVYPEQRARAAAAVAAVTGGPAPSADALGALSNRITQMEMELRQRQGGTLGNLLLFGMVALISILMFGYQLFFSRPHGQLKLLDIDPKTGDALYIEVFRQPPPDSMRPADPKDKKPEGPQEKK
jgi:proteasome lid subunit RPN8/RPN11